MYVKSLILAYPFIFHNEEDGGYFIESVDVEGAYTGVSQNDIAYGMCMAKEVLGMTLADMIESGEEIPKPSNINDIKCDDGFVTMVMVNVEEYFKDNTLVKKTLNIPKWANDLGVRIGINFSKALTDAISGMAINK